MKVGGFHTDVAVHDPAIFVDEDGKYYIFGTHMTAAYSKDLRNWESFADGVNKENPLFDNLFDENEEAFAYCGKFNGEYYAVWAPDVSYNPYLKKYVMYFCTSGSYIKSSICMATSDSVKGPYHFERVLLSSGFDETTIDSTNVKDYVGENEIGRYMKKSGGYNNLAWPNCIDPNLFHDKDGRLWMVYGSWSGGIFLLEMDEKTGLPIHPKTDEKNHVDAYFGKKLLGGGHKSIEGPFVLYDKVADYYYLFVSFGWLARDGGYQIRMFRSKKPEGPYVDMDGRTFRRVNHHDPYGLKLVGNYIFPSMECGYKSPGHNSAFEDQDGQIYIAYHQRFDMESERHEPRVHQLFRTKNNWLTVCPFATEGEMLAQKNYQETEIAGVYYLVEHGLDISTEVHKPVEVEFTMDGNILTKSKNKYVNYGTYTLDDGGRVTLQIKDVTYECVVIQLNDEAGNPTMCITGVGANQSAWAVKYL